MHTHSLCYSIRQLASWKSICLQCEQLIFAWFEHTHSSHACAIIISSEYDQRLHDIMSALQPWYVNNQIHLTLSGHIIHTRQTWFRLSPLNGLLWRLFFSTSRTLFQWFHKSISIQVLTFPYICFAPAKVLISLLSSIEKANSSSTPSSSRIGEMSTGIPSDVQCARKKNRREINILTDEHGAKLQVR